MANSNFNKIFKDVNSVDKNESKEVKFWSELGVNYEFNKERGTRGIHSMLTKRLKTYTVKTIKEISELSEIEINENETKESIIKNLCDELSDSKKLLLINLFQFMSRKKKTINQYYELYMDHEEQNLTDTFSKLYFLYQNSPAHLFSIRTLNLWQSHGTGNIYGFDKALKKSTAKSVVSEFTFEEKLRDKLYKASKEQNYYKIHSYCIYDDLYIVLLYKETNDVTKEDFNGAIRNKEVSRILFGIDTKNNLFEIKTEGITENIGVKEYLEETFVGTATRVKEDTFDELDQTQVKESILLGKSPSGEFVDDFIVDRIKFRESPLENSPSLTISLKNIDISQSVYDAYEKGAIDISSIKSIESISFLSNGTRRTVFSSILENGNVIFQMDDSRMDASKKSMIEEKFFQRFGFPLYKRISNIGSTDGDADLVDYIMKNRNGKNFSVREKEKQDDLFSAGLLEEKIVQKYKCTDSMCHYEDLFENNEDTIEECPECEAEIKIITDRVIFINDEKVRKYVDGKFRQICKNSSWENQRYTKRKVLGDTFEFLELKNSESGKSLKVLVSSETISGLALSKLKKLLDPTLIISVGQGYKAIERYSSGCFSAISFGNFFERDVKSLTSFLEKTIHTLELKTKDYIASAASESFAIIQEKITDPKTKKYTPSDYEDDVYTILKDLFINVQKWGHEYNGVELPEGIFTLSFEENIGKRTESNKLAFSYDCKLNMDLKGYRFTIGEKDKAKRYIESLSGALELSEFTNSNHLDGHIFISNKFNETNVDNTYRDIKEAIRKNYDTEIIFLSNDALLCLHEQYRKNLNLIESSKDLFFNLISNFLLKSNGQIIKKDHIDFIIGKTLRYATRKVIDFKELTNEITNDFYNIFKA